MSKDFEKILSLTESKEVSEGVDLPRVKLHKWLALGQTEWVCKYGTLSDGHEKFTDAQKYSQALKEMYYLSLNIKAQQAIAMEAEAGILEGKEELKWAWTKAKKLRANAKIKKNESQLTSALYTVEDQMRMVRVYYQVIQELGPKVEAKYPDGMEQAELDNWKTIFEYRIKKGNFESTQNVCLPPAIKAEMGLIYGRPEAIAPLQVKDPELLKIISESVKEPRLIRSR